MNMENSRMESSFYLVLVLFLAGDGDAGPEAGAGEHDGGDQGAGERGRAHIL